MIDYDLWNFCILILILIGFVWLFHLVKEFRSIMKIRTSIETDQVAYDPTYSQQFPFTPIFSRPHYETIVKTSGNENKGGTELTSTYESYQLIKESFKCDRPIESPMFNVSFDFSSIASNTQAQVFFGVDSRKFKQCLKSIVVERKKLVEEILEEITKYQKKRDASDQIKNENTNKTKNKNKNKNKKKSRKKRKIPNHRGKNSFVDYKVIEPYEDTQSSSTILSSEDFSFNQEMNINSLNKFAKKHQSQIQLTVEAIFQKHMKKKMYHEITPVIENIIEIDEKDSGSEVDNESEMESEKSTYSFNNGLLEKEKEKENKKEKEKRKKKNTIKIKNEIQIETKKIKKEILIDFKQFLECSKIQNFAKGELNSFQSENFSCEQLSKIFRSEFEVKNTQMYPLIIVIQSNTNFDFSKINFLETDMTLLRRSIIENFPRSQFILADFSGFQYSPHIQTIFNSFGANFYVISDVYGDYEESSECVICFSERKEVILLNCCHLCVCKQCYPQIEKCPICRASFNSYILFNEAR
ncbi:sbp (s-ribonuclease binding protein) family protein [Anaeramoeba flamelloides]|uniref:Sbp (S-ribonuclease binding protein) family protein n=1 Tax=Anaeramoeba flamelloides TaxID=1746091 RepID=A0AAV7YPU7_9EUKA|nr:sbp (s-ribonuclease binding protein) family protein [Anaeramoeba flamelloides]